GHGSFIALEYGLQRLGHELLEFALIHVRVIELRTERLEQRFVDAALEGREWVLVAHGPAGRATPLERRRPGHPHLGEALRQAHAAFLRRRARAALEWDTGSPSRRCCTSFPTAWLTGWPGVSMVIGTPLLIEIGTALLDGM